jgi:hypothetical protein
MAALTPLPTPVPTAYLKPYVYPQPASVKVTFVYSLYQAAQVKIIIYNIAGMDVAVIEQQGIAGNNQKEFYLSALAPGAYYYVIKVSYGSRTDSYEPGKFLVIK